MGFLSRLFGMDEGPGPRDRLDAMERNGRAAPSADEQALERYRYMMRTAPPETVEQAHAEAFAKLTPEQRRMLLVELAKTAPPNERASVEATPTDDPRALARVATRAEMRQPGVMERSLASPGMGLGASLLTSFAAGFVGSMVAQSFFSALGGFGAAGAEDTAAQDETADTEQADTQYADGSDYGDEGGGFDGGGDFEV
ncbi:MAG TPA: hypothetical protein VFZ53_16750 [Polyangiaceae bacterium]